MIPLAGPPGSIALMNAPDAVPGYEALLPADTTFRNEVAARVAPTIMAYRPGRAAKKINFPILFCVSNTDTVTPPTQTLRYARTAPRGEIKRYDAGHFDFYLGEAFEALVHDQVEFLTRHLHPAQLRAAHAAAHHSITTRREPHERHHAHHQPDTARRRQTMKAFVVSRYGKANSVEAVELPEPELGDSDVLIQIHAASVNPLDLKIRNGELKPLLPYKLPLVLGNDLAGVVVKAGRNVQRFKPGDEVYAKPDKDRIGAFAEFIAISENDVAKKPHRLDMEQAASIPLVGLTAWQALVEKAKLRPGQKVLIHAGSGGLGTIAIQLAKHLGATVATTTSTANVEWVKRLGADVVIDYRSNDFETVLHDYDVVIDTQGGQTLEKSLRVLKPGGKVISVAGPPEPDFAKEFGANWFLIQAMRALSFQIRRKAKRRGVTYSFLFMRASGDQLRELGSLIDSGVIRPVVDRIFPFQSTTDALAYVEKGRAKGKVVIKIR